MVVRFSDPAVVMLARDYMDFAIQASEIILCRHLSKQREISQVIDGVIWLNNLIPILNQGLIHFGSR